ncbi:MAG: tRNA (guanosine(37)-N1)-methyltransferase TrmD [Eubacteriaceae bacterium]
MINFTCVGLFEGFIKAYSQYSIIARAVKNQTAQINFVNIRDFSKDKHKNTDDYPYGGGAGMVMTAQPVFDAVNYAKENRDIPVIYFSPIGKTLNSEIAKKYAEYENLILLCGHYEGVDQRALDLTVTEYISIGDYILTGGEIAAVVFMDSVLRYCEGFLGNAQSSSEESFENGLLEYAQYTRPEVFNGLKVPDVLISGNHAKINEYRHTDSIERTKKYRKDLYDEYISTINKNDKTK